LRDALTEFPNVFKKFRTGFPGIRYHGVSSWPAAGNATVKTLPLPTALSTLIVPPLASTRFLQTASPSPMPLGLVVNSGSNSLSGCSGAMPPFQNRPGDIANNLMTFIDVL
jgi:hypothetical protein